MKQFSVILCLFLVFYLPCKCFKNSTDREKKSFPSFRRQVEEIPDDITADRSEDDAKLNLIAFLVKNAKKLFGESEDTAFVTRTTVYTKPTFSTLIYQNKTMNVTTLDKPTLNRTSSASSTNSVTSINSKNTETTLLLSFSNSNISSNEKLNAENNVTKPLETKSISMKINIIRSGNTSDFIPYVESSRTPMFHFTNEHTDEPITTSLTLKTLDNFISEPSFNDAVAEKKQTPVKRTCIMCNNVHMKECNDPHQKLVPTVICDREDDVCYSQQTPFGLIDRGCFNINLNMTIYVCSCNLCNYISISEMPFIFSKRRDWVDNIIDLSRTNGFRSSIYKDMSCLSCEVNSTVKSFDVLHNTNCLEGNVGVLPTQHCADDEICGIKALRSDGYIWRGCLKSPLYNYWWSLCDTDLCNYDAVTSLYDQT